MTKEEQLKKAASLGRQAFSDGKQQAPFLNEKLMLLLEGRRVGETPVNEASNEEIMRAYSDAWVAANLDADEEITPNFCPKCGNSKVSQATISKGYIEVGEYSDLTSSFDAESEVTIYQCSTCHIEFTVLE